MPQEQTEGSATSSFFFSTQHLEPNVIACILCGKHCVRAQHNQVELACVQALSTEERNICQSLQRLPVLCWDFRNHSQNIHGTHPSSDPPAVPCPVRKTRSIRRRWGSSERRKAIYPTYVTNSSTERVPLVEAERARCVGRTKGKARRAQKQRLTGKQENPSDTLIPGI